MHPAGQIAGFFKNPSATVQRVLYQSDRPAGQRTGQHPLASRGEKVPLSPRMSYCCLVVDLFYDVRAHHEIQPENKSLLFFGRLQFGSLAGRQAPTD